MTSQLTEKDLLDNGFSSKQLSRLKEVLSRGENAGETLSTIMDELSKRLIWWGCLYDAYPCTADFPSRLLYALAAVILLTCCSYWRY